MGRLFTSDNENNTACTRLSFIEDHPTISAFTVAGCIAIAAFVSGSTDAPVDIPSTPPAAVELPLQGL